MTQNTYYPNESARITANVSVLGVVEAPISLTLVVTDSSGNVTSYPNALVPIPPPSQWSQTLPTYYQDITFPATPALGRWSYYWTSVGSQINQQGVSAPGYFYVAALGQP
jgi:hypothetical protein